MLCLFTLSFACVCVGVCVWCMAILVGLFSVDKEWEEQAGWLAGWLL